MALAESLPCILFTFTGLTGNTCKLRYCNNSLMDVFGITTVDQLDDCPLPFSKLNTLDESHLTQRLQELLDGLQTAVEVRFQILHDNHPYWFILQAAQEQHDAAHTSIAPQFQGAIYEITQQYANQQKALDSASYFLDILDQLPDRFFYKDTQSRFLGGNKAWREHHKFGDDQEWIGKTDMDSSRFSPAFSRKLFEEEQEMMRTGQSIRQREALEQSDGSLSYAESIKSPLYDSQHQLIGLVGLSRDITEQVKIEQALAQAKQSAEAAVMAKSAFLAVMSHEIRTPMNGVIGCASLLADTPLSDEQQQLVHTIQSCGENLLYIINDILDYSKIEADQLNLESHNFNLRELIEDTFDLFSKTAADKKIEINYVIAPEIPSQLSSDSSRIRQVLINLLGNAIKFTPEGEVTLCCKLINLNNETHSCEILFEIADTGIGIPEAIRPKLFEAFTQADATTTRKFGGTGLGLAISKKIVEAMGGAINFDSKEGVGTQFRFTLPCKYIAEIDQAPSFECAQLEGKHVLVVDDNTTNRKILAATLKQWKMTCTCFSAPEHALENFAHDHSYDLAILDQCMPKMQGTELAVQLQAQNPAAPIPVIILSSAADKISSPHQHLQHLQKPAHNSQLLRALLRLLQLDQQQQSAKPNHPTTTNITAANITAANIKTRVLVVEDNSVNQMVIIKMLKKLGYQNITAVADGHEAVKTCKTVPVEIILMDIQMRFMDGYTATEKIRAQQNAGAQPWIIALTAGVQQTDAERAFECGMNAFATKPIQLHELSEALSTAEKELSKHHS
jgi:PAS domain S-box-containing protein